MKRKLAKKPELAEKLIPKYAFGCRRLTPGNGYLESLCMDNVTPEFTPIREITEKGIVTADGVLHEVDAIVCATGFDVSFKPRFPVIGRKNLDLGERWKDFPDCYMSMSVSGFPNYFIFLGPNAPVGHGSLVPIIETVADYLLKVIKKLRQQSVKSIEPKAEAIRDFNIHTHEFMKSTAWSSSCSSWFKNGKVNGPVVAMWPGSRMQWFEAISEPRFEDYNYTYIAGNRFSYLGNGFSKRELDGADLTWYLDSPDL
ncbi:steroid monooxygenase [Dipodascopsis uninucleata]